MIIKKDKTHADASRFSFTQTRTVLLATTAIIALGGACSPAHAQAVIDGGAVVDVPGTHASPWNVGGPLTVGNASAGTLNIGVGGVAGTVNNDAATIGNNAGSNGAVYVTGSGSVWTSSNVLTIGRAGDGVVAISNGGKANSNGAYLGLVAGSSGIMTVDGSASSWAAGSFLTIGYDGSGTLTVSNGAKATASNAVIGLSNGSSGVTTITGPGSSWGIVHDLTVGDAGMARLTVSNGGEITSERGIIAQSATGDGEVRVTGPGSKWTTTDTLTVGNEGKGLLAISNGGMVSSARAELGAIAGSTGNVTIDGSASSWVAGSYIWIGESGSGELTVSNGAKVTAGRSVIGLNQGASGIATITGSGSALTVTNDVVVGDAGMGRLTVSGGGVVASTAGIIGKNATGDGEVSVTGPGSMWTTTDTLTVGNEGKGLLAISNGGMVSSARAELGAIAGSTGNVTIDGSASSWVAGSYIWIGESGSGELTVSNGAKVTAGRSVIGLNQGASGIATITGSGSALTVTNDVVVGDAGMGRLTVSGGGVVASTAGIIGKNATGDGEVSVTGPGSMWTTTDTLTVGNEGKGLLAISNGGMVSSARAELGAIAGSTGNVTIDGSASSWVAGSYIWIGESGSGELTVSNGAKVTAGRSVIGLNQGASGIATITGSGSALTVTNDVVVGDAGMGRLTVSGGGVVASTAGIIGKNATGDGEVSVTGPGSMWTTTNTLTVGNEGSGKLTIAAGGVVSNVNGFISYNGGITAGGSTVTVTGAGSTWTNTGDLYVAEIGNGSLRIDNGGTVTAVTAYIGENTGGHGVVEVDGVGSKLALSNELTVGRLDEGRMSITSGGLVSNAGDGLIGYGGGGSAIGQVRVDGAGSAWKNSKDLYVGYYGQGDLQVLNGGAVSSDNGFIGYASSGTGTATVDGAGSKWTIGTDLVVGSAGTGALTISNGASVTVGGVLRIAKDSGSIGTLTIGAEGGSPAVAPGTLNATNVAFGGGIGALNFNHTSTNYIFSSVISGNGAINQVAGVTRLTADSSAFVGLTTIGGGTLLVDGKLGSGPVDVANGGTLGGMGTIGGTVSVASGGTLLGVQGQTLSMQNLSLAAGSNVNVTLSTPGGAALFNVANNLTLDGTLNITSGGAFGPGVYRVMNYGGTLTDNGLVIGSTPSGSAAGDFAVQTAVAGQVNLINNMTPTTTFWDGDGAGNANNNSVNGGSGVWTATSTNWTTYNGSTNGAMQPQPGFAIFQGTAGTVTADASAGALAVTGMQFASDGYQITGAPITLADPNSILRVGDGSVGGATYKAIIASELTGSGGLNKTDLGTLILTGANSYSGGTTITGGTLQIGNGGAAGSISGDVTNNGVLAFGRTDATTFGGAVTGSGAVKLLTGDVTLTAANSYTGGTNIAGGSTLRLGNGGTTGSITGNVTNNGALAFNRSDNVSFAGVISGAGNLSQIGAGKTQLTGDSSAFTGATTISNGTLLVDGKLGSGPVGVQSGGTLGGMGTIGGTVSVASGGTLLGIQGQTLSMQNLSLSAGSNVNVTLSTPGGAALFDVASNLTLDGTLNITSGGAFGPGVYRLMNYGGSLTDNGMAIGSTPSGTAAGDFAVQTAVAGQVNLINSTSTTPLTLAFWDGDAAANANNNAVDGGSGVWSATSMNWTTANGATNGAMLPQPGFAIFEGTAGTVTVDASAGAVAVTGMQFASDGYQITGAPITLADPTSIIRVGDGTAAGANYKAIIASELTGSGGLNKTDLGTLILTGANSYTGGTAIAAGTLQIGNGGTSGSITGNVMNNGILAFNRSNDWSFGGVISGTGNLRQVGAGKIELTGDSSGFGGTTFVENGILAVNGKLGGALNVLAAGRLQGTGTVGNTVVNGTIAPGNSIGTLNVAGNITFNSGSIYEVEVNAAGQSDKIVASGTGTINGGSVKVLAGSGNYAPATTYTILTANGGRSGTFTGGVTSNLAFLDPSLSYDANNVYLTMLRNDIDFASIGLTPNQIATGGGVETLGWGNPIYNAVVNLSAPQAQYAFDQLSGEVHASAKTVMIEDSRFLRSAVNDRLRAAFGGVGASGGNTVTYDGGKPRAVAADTDGGAVWGQAFGSWGHWNSDGNAAKLDRSIGGFFMGADAPAFDTWRFGAVAGYSRSSFNVKDRHSSGTSDNYSVGLYGGTQWGDLAFRTGAAYTISDISTKRSVNFAGFGDSLSGDYRAGTAQVFGELGYKMQAGNVAFEPFANLAYVNLRTDGFSEKGGVAALTSRSTVTDTTFTTLGLRASSTFDLGGMAVTAKGMLGWRHAFGDTTPNSVMSFAGSSPFSIGGVPIAKNAAVVDLGLDMNLSANTTLGVSYGGQFGSGVTDQTLRANFSVKF